MNVNTRSQRLDNVLHYLNDWRISLWLMWLMKQDTMK